LNPAEQGIQGQLVGTNIVERRQAAVEHVVQPTIGTRSFQNRQIAWRLDHADDARIALRVGADRTEFPFSEIGAFLARMNLFDNRPQGLCQTAGHCPIPRQEEMRDPFR
jgi:hypothetical protein